MLPLAILVFASKNLIHWSAATDAGSNHQLQTSEVLETSEVYSGAYLFSHTSLSRSQHVRNKTMR